MQGCEKVTQIAEMSEKLTKTETSRTRTENRAKWSGKKIGTSILKTPGDKKNYKENFTELYTWRIALAGTQMTFARNL